MTTKKQKTDFEEEKDEILKYRKNEQGQDRPAIKISKKKEMMERCLEEPKMKNIKLVESQMIQPKMIIRKLMKEKIVE